MKHLWLLCVLHSALCVLGSDASDIQNAGHSTKYNMTRSYISDSWQSSAFNNRCFLDTAVAGEWDYFHTKNVPDSDGFHWLLIQLPHAIRVKSVTVYGRKSAPSRAESVEILLSDRLPAALNASNGSCYATLSGSLSSLTQCGVTKREETATHRVACRYSNCTKMTKYILLMRNVQNETDKYMNFQALEVEEGTQRVQIFRCQSSSGGLADCKLNDLRILTNADRVVMKLCPPCQLTSKDDAACHVAAQSGSVTQLKVNGNPDSFLVTQFIFDSKTQGGNFTCSFNCSKGETITATESIGYTEKKPKSITIQPLDATSIGSRKFIAAGSDFLFSFTTEAAYPSPAHTCKLVQAAEKTDVEVASGELIAPTSERAQRDSTANSSHEVSLISEYRLNMSADKIGKFIQCVSTVPGTAFKAVVPALLPEVVGPSKPDFRLPPDLDWKDGGLVTVTVDSSKDNPVPTSHSCYLETQGSKKSLHAIQVTNTSSEFALNVSRGWGSSASLVCLVNQSGLIDTWARHELPKVLHKAKGVEIIDIAQDLLSGTETDFLLTASDPGYPPAQHQCRIGNRNMSGDKIPSSSGLSHWSFILQRSDNGNHITCSVQQLLNGTLIFDQQVNSSALNVKYTATVTWPSSSAQVVKEGEILSVSVIADGNPQPSRQCWIQLTSGSQVSLSHVEQSNSTNSSFSLTADRSMNGGNLTCLVTQHGLNSAVDQIFTQSVTVFYPPRPPLTIDLLQTVYEGTSVNFTVRSGDAKPSVAHSCEVNYGTITKVSQTSAQSEYNTTLEYTPSRNDTSVRCSAVQMTGSEVVFTNNISKDVTVNYKAFSSVQVSPTERVFEGNSVNVTLTSHGGRPAVSEHECWLAGSRVSMENSTRIFGAVYFTFRAQREHNKKFLACKFLQDVRLTEWRNISLNVFYKANVTGNIKLQSQRVRVNSSVQFSLVFSDLGNPPAEPLCCIGSRRLPAVAPSAASMSASNMFKVGVTGNGLEIVCHVVQTDSRGVAAFNQTVFSPTLDVLYPVSLSYFATQPPVVREGDPLNVSFVSLGGNPPPSHLCWLKTAQGPLKEPVPVSSSKTGQQVESSFSVKSTRRLNRGSVTCRVSQDGLEDLAGSFHQNVSVLFPSMVNLTGSKISGHSVIVKINVTDGNPLPNVNCSLLSATGSRHEVASNVSQTFSVGEHSVEVKLDAREQSRAVNVSCSVDQKNEGFKSKSFFLMELESNERSFSGNQQGSAGSAVGAAVGSLLAVALIAAAALLLLRARRLRQTGRNGVCEPASSSRKGGNRRTETPTRRSGKQTDQTELEFMKSHYLYPKPRMEYATVVKGELLDSSNLADSSETLYLTIVGCSQSEDDEEAETAAAET